MASHLLLMAIFAALVSTVFALLMREDPREQIRLGAVLFASFVGAAIVLGWLMYPFPI
jgi:heme/copper-type cytochrome/quinol oxidase subunit 4